MNHSIASIKTSEIIGCKVIDIDKHYLGNINDIIINKYSGQISYITIKKKGFLGMGKDSFTLSWNNLYYDEVERCYIVNVSLELAQAEC